MIQSQINTILSSFDPVGLNEMDEVSLMDRVETKYVFSVRKLTDLLGHLSGSYRVLEIDCLRIFPYQTTYLDTFELLFYLQQIRGKLNRYKVRYRCYESTGLSFLEIKKRTNTSRTIKWRIENSSDPNFPDEEAYSFMKENLPCGIVELRPVLKSGFSRITLVGKEIKERITLDSNLTFASPGSDITELPFLAIAELKRERHCATSPFGQIMKHIGVPPNHFSKYCIGSNIACKTPRTNTLKPTILLINKIKNEYFKSDAN
jgi:hypothetical protein